MTLLRNSPLVWAFAPAILLVLYGGYLKGSEQPQRALPEKAITVTYDSGAVVRFAVEMAVTPAEREKGLMFCRSLAANSGMLFLFPKTQVVDFWMKDTILLLDMVFIRANGVVDSIARNQPPFSLANTFSAGPVIGALEIPAGTTDRLGLKAGDKVTGLEAGCRLCVCIGPQVGPLSNEAQVTDVHEKFCSPWGPDRRRSGPRPEQRFLFFARELSGIVKGVPVAC
jgi:uncharacterized membrane protein (UPF0127 family)